MSISVGYVQEEHQGGTATDPGVALTTSYTPDGRTGDEVVFEFMIANTGSSSIYVCATAAENGPTAMEIPAGEVTPEPIGPYAYGHLPYLWSAAPCTFIANCLRRGAL